MPISEDATKTRWSIREYKSARRRVETITWPGTDREVGLLYLHCIDQQKAYFEARKHFDRQNQPIEPLTIDQFNLEIDYQLIYRMLLEPDAENPEARLFRSVSEVRAELTPNEAVNFIGEHLALQSKEADEWALGKQPSHLRQIARLLDVDETTEPDAIVELVRQRIGGNDG